METRPNKIFPDKDDIPRSSSSYRSSSLSSESSERVTTTTDNNSDSASTSESNISDSQKLQEQRYALDMSVYASIDDLTHLVGPLTEESVVRCLQSRFYSQVFQTKIGPVVVTLNSNRHRPSPTVLADPSRVNSMFQNIIKDSVSQHADTGNSQAIIVCGESGSGKTFCAMQLLRELFDIVGGGSGTDAFKHLSATLTVLQSLCSATTISNPESSRVGMFVENFITDAAIYRTKIHAFPLDRERVCNIQRNERNYHIFYQMLAGLSTEEKGKFHLSGYSVHNLRYLSSGQTNQNEANDKSRFDAWKNSLSVLGIPFSDVMRILSSVLLLGNVEFVEGTGLELDIVGNNEIKAVAALLGVSGVALYRGFTTRTRNTRGQVCKSLADVTTANITRDCLAKALYCRTMSAILKRANSLRKPTYSSLSDSTESNLHKEPVCSSSKDSGLSHLGSGRHFDKLKFEGFISIVDMFGFEISEVNRLEQLCINLCAETIQHYYNTHMFKSTMQALQEEDIRVETEVAYFDNEPILELLSSQRSGVFHILDTECTQPRTSAETYVSKVKAHHRINNYFFEPLTKAQAVFGIRHFAGRVVYDATNFLSSNRDVLPDDIICIFSKQNCNFGFASHLFAQEVKHVSVDGGPGPRGMKHRILHTSSLDHSGNRGTLCGDFQNKLDSLLKTLVHSKPQFVHCMKTNDHGEMDLFDKDVVIRQLRSLQLLETVSLMAGGIPHRMRYKAFNNRYRIFLAKRNPYLIESQQNHCKEILNSFLRAMDESKLPYVSTQWMMGKKHLFFSELTRQHLEAMRTEKIYNAVSRIQAYWRAWKCRQRWPLLKIQLQDQKKHQKVTQPYKRKSGRLKKTTEFKREPELLQQASKYYNINLEQTPEIPLSRTYCVSGQVRLGYPQVRIMKGDYPIEANDGQVFCRGDEVQVVGPSQRRGHLIVEKDNICLDVPYSLLGLKTVPEPPGVDI